MASEALLVCPDSERIARCGRVATLGMFIIDHFEVRGKDGRSRILDEEAIGGGGVFAMCAARMFLPPSKCCLLVDKGHDFPPDFEDLLSSFGKEMTWFRQRNGKTTRALNIYSGKAIGEGHQSFRYLSPQLHLSPKDFILPPSPFADPLPEYLHIVCVTERAEAIANELDAIRHGDFAVGRDWDPKVVWEPLGRCCKPEEMKAILRAASRFAVFSPNLLEMQSILGLDPRHTLLDAERAAQAFHDGLVTVRNTAGATGHSTAVIVRAGDLGSYTLSDTWTGWVPAFWSAREQDQVVDPTGGGNAWLGGLLAGLSLSDGNPKIGSIYGSVAASFAIQQRGLPVYLNGKWNDDDPWRRLREMATRINMATT